MSKENYFTERDARNIATIEKIIAEDLPDFTEEYFVGISSRTTTLTRLNYAYDLPDQQIINSNHIGIAVMQGLAGSFGVVLCVPVTVVICSFLYASSRRNSTPSLSNNN